MQDNICKLIELKNSKEWISFEKYYMNYNVFNQFDFFRLEDIHTNVLKSLWIYVKFLDTFFRTIFI